MSPARDTDVSGGNRQGRDTHHKLDLDNVTFRLSDSERGDRGPGKSDKPTFRKLFDPVAETNFLEA